VSPLSKEDQIIPSVAAALIMLDEAIQAKVGNKRPRSGEVEKELKPTTLPRFL
jgi:hypothetical protein